MDAGRRDVTLLAYYANCVLRVLLLRRRWLACTAPKSKVQRRLGGTVETLESGESLDLQVSEQIFFSCFPEDLSSL